MSSTPHMPQMPALAEDLTQEAFVRVLGRFGNLRNTDGFRTYVMRTVVTLSKNHFRRRAVERKHLMPTMTQTTTSPERDDNLLDALRKHRLPLQHWHPELLLARVPPPSPPAEVEGYWHRQSLTKPGIAVNRAVVDPSSASSTSK